MSRLPYIRNRVATAQLGPRVPIITLEEQERFSPGLLWRKRQYRSERWRKLRWKMLATKECKRCFFCGERATVLEHLVGHGDDYADVAQVLGLPPPKADMKERFWDGPLVGSCQDCARSRTGAETAHRLVSWTKDWLASKPVDWGGRIT